MGLGRDFLTGSYDFYIFFIIPPKLISQVVNKSEICNAITKLVILRYSYFCGNINMAKLKCDNCGSNQLAYQQYVRCVIPVGYDGQGNNAYNEHIYDEDPTPNTQHGYCCRNCGQMVEHHGVLIETEQSLLNYCESK